LARSVLFGAIVLIVPPAVAWAIGTLLENAGAVQFFTTAVATLTATATTIGAWARAAAGAVAKADAVIAQVAQEYEKAVESDPAVLASKEKLDEAQAKAVTASAALDAAREELASAKTEAANATLPAQMLQLVSGRLDNETYGKELTTLSLARADLQALSDLLREQRDDVATGDGAAQAESEAEPKAAARAVDRVILYVDDLDRCKPADVVRVLQLVHMLLAFELFVVVVAVDARWVAESLRASYKWLRTADGDPPVSADADAENDSAVANDAEVALDAPSAGGVTAQDYLEKIFQIAFWLEPMTRQRAASFLGSLVRQARRESGPVVGTTPSGPAAADPASTRSSSQVTITGIELDYMRALAAHVGPSPRRVKRLVNVYRLIKARLSDSQLATFLTDREADDGTLRSGPYQLVIGLLVIGTGAAAASAQILRELAEWDPGEPLTGVVERFRARNHTDWTMAARVIETLMRTQRSESVSELRGWARTVGRFMLNRLEPKHD
jgi:hypothetical protein